MDETSKYSYTGVGGGAGAYFYSDSKAIDLEFDDNTPAEEEEKLNSSGEYDHLEQAKTDS